jgi:hypothetical protein
MKKVLKLAAGLIAAATMSTTASAADMWVKRDGKFTYIYFKGDIVKGDYQKFAKVAAGKPANPNTIVVLGSDGGLADEAIDISLYIRKYKLSTVAAGDCFSSCALIWLAGWPRGVFDNVNIGFHAIYKKDDNGKPITSSVGNAFVGAYLTKLGFGWETIAYLTSTNPDEIEYLNLAKAKQYGIKLTVVPSKGG